MRWIATIALSLLLGLSACSPSAPPPDCRPAEGGIGGTGAPECERY